MASILRAVAKAIQFSRTDFFLAIIFILLMVPVHELIHAGILFLFGCSSYIYFDPLVYPIMKAGFVQSTCTLNYFQQKVVSLAPNVLLGTIGLAMIIYGHAKILQCYRKHIQIAEKLINIQTGASRTRANRRNDKIIENLSRECMSLDHSTYSSLVFWGTVFIAALLFSILMHIIFPIITDWSALTCPSS